MNWLGLGISFAAGFAAKWLHGALKLQPKTAEQVDKVLGKPGEAQAILNDVEQAADTVMGQEANKLAGGK